MMLGLPFVNGINSTSLKVVTGCVLAVMINVFYCLVQAYLMIAHSTPLEPIVFGEILTFDAAFAGIAYAQFAKKRETEIVTPPQTTAEHAAPVTASQMQAVIAAGEATATKPTLAARLAPTAGVAPKDPDVREAIQAYAEKQREAAAALTDDDEGLA